MDEGQGRTVTIRALAQTRIGSRATDAFRSTFARTPKALPCTAAKTRSSKAWTAGWNACAGLGVPKGAEIIDALSAVPVA